MGFINLIFLISKVSISASISLSNWNTPITHQSYSLSLQNSSKIHFSFIRENLRIVYLKKKRRRGESKLCIYRSVYRFWKRILFSNKVWLFKVQKLRLMWQENFCCIFTDKPLSCPSIGLKPKKIKLLSWANWEH